MSVYPAMSSFASANGPSITVGLPLEKRTRAPLSVGLSPSPPVITPAFTISSLNFIIAVTRAWVGITLASVSASAFLMIMNRMNPSPCSSLSRREVGSPWLLRLCFQLLPRLALELEHLRHLLLEIAEVFRREHLAELDLRLVAGRVRDALHPR